jgi:hypothetical protein
MVKSVGGQRADAVKRRNSGGHPTVIGAINASLSLRLLQRVPVCNCGGWESLALIVLAR